MQTISINEAQERFLELVSQAKNGEAFIIADEGQPLVKVSPVLPYENSPRFGFMRGYGFVDKDVDIKAIAREEIIAMFEGECDDDENFA
jgi:antitoxin (DNA-binding transcriptional repressor) of toxin-antitoxin stability system